jgi:signal transduction histidine kinase
MAYGLELSIAQTIARWHGGEIAVESELGVVPTVLLYFAAE